LPEPDSLQFEKRNRLAGEIHDGLAQNFTAICMQLEAAKEQLSLKEGDPLKSIQRALDLAEFGLAEARRCAHNLRSQSGISSSQSKEHFLCDRFFAQCGIHFRKPSLQLWNRGV
jgi:signal transduction histidine kinase